MRRYETTFILRSDAGEGQTKDIIKRFEEIVATAGGDLVETDEWGLRELAYRVRGQQRGYYVRLDYVAPATVVTELERNLKLSDAVVRYLSVMVEPEADAAKLRQEAAARRHHATETKAAEAQEATAEGGQAQPAESEDIGQNPLESAHEGDGHED